MSHILKDKIWSVDYLMQHKFKITADTLLDPKPQKQKEMLDMIKIYSYFFVCQVSGTKVILST